MPNNSKCLEYKLKNALPNKLIQDDGVVTDIMGKPVGQTVPEYDIKAAIPNKLLNPDGTYSTLNEILANSIDKTLFIVVDALPETGEENKIYLTTDENGLLQEYVYVNGEWNKMGEMYIDLSGLTTVEQVEEMITSKGFLTQESDPTVPQHVKDITEEDINNWNNKSEFSGKYEDLEGQPAIPSKVSELENDSNFINEDYYKTNTGDLKDYWANAESFGIKTIVHALNHLTDWVKAHFTKKPVVIYDNPTGFEASNNDAGDTWHLTGLDLSPYKRLKFYVCSGGDGDANYSPAHIVEVHLDNRAKGSFDYFSGDHAGHCPNNRNRHHIVTFIVNAEKTAIQFQHSISIYGTAASDSVGGRRCYLIEGYYD